MQGAWIAAAIGLMALIVVLPVPLGNLLPPLAMMLIGLAFRDADEDSWCWHRSGSQRSELELQ